MIRAVLGLDAADRGYEVDQVSTKTGYEFGGFRLDTVLQILVNLSGTARGAFWIDDIEHSWNVFLRDLVVLEADEVPVADAKAVRQADTRLN